MRQGWAIRTLKDVGDISSGNSINDTVKKEKYLNLPEGFPYIATKDIGYDTIINYENGVRIPFSEKDSFRIAARNSVLICAEGGSAGRKIGRVDQDVCFVNKLFALAIENEITSKYVFYWYHSNTFQREFKSRLTGLIGGVSKKKFETISIPYPPMSDQKRIVKILDETFVAIEKAIANVEKNLQNSRELFESCLQGVFEDSSIIWVKHSLKDLLKEQPRNGWSPPLKYQSRVGTPVLTLSAVTGFEFDVTKCKHTTISTEANSHYWIENEDLLISRSNTTELVGHVAICSNVESPTIYPDLIMKMKPNKDTISTHFLYYQLRSSKLRTEIMARAHGANPTMKKINKSDVQSLPIVLCDRGTQNNIVNNLTKFDFLKKQLIEHYSKKIVHLEELKKSILQKAFDGKL